jgi:hypothetical protein
MKKATARASHQIRALQGLEAGLTGLTRRSKSPWNPTVRRPSGECGFITCVENINLVRGAPAYLAVSGAHADHQISNHADQTALSEDWLTTRAGIILQLGFAPSDSAWAKTGVRKFRACHLERGAVSISKSNHDEYSGRTPYP